MKRRTLVTLGSGLTAVAIAMVAGGVVAAEKEQEVELKDLPAAVRATAEANAQGGTLAEAELEEENGRQVYEVEVKKAGGEELELKIAPDGTLLKIEKEDEDDKSEGEWKEEKIELSQAPAGVQSAVAAAVKDGAVLKAVVREQEKGATVYEAEYTIGNVEHSLKLAASGAVIEQENEVTTSSLPAEVSEAVRKAFPNGQIHEAEEVKLHFYEVEITEGGKKREVKVSAGGQILGRGHDDDDDDKD